MTIFSYIIIGLWVVLFAVWIFGALTAKRTAWARWRFNWSYRIAFVVIVFLALRLPVIDRWLHELARVAHGDLLQTSLLWGAIGAGITLVGVGTAISARFTLGRNWGMPMTERVEPELVTSGVYAYIRHPIYTGFMFGMIGAAIGESVVWLIPLVASAPYYFYSAKREEKLMLRLFPDEYPAYRARTRGFLPWIL